MASVSICPTGRSSTAGSGLRAQGWIIGQVALGATTGRRAATPRFRRAAPRRATLPSLQKVPADALRDWLDCENAIEPELNESCARPVGLGRLAAVRRIPETRRGPLPTSVAARVARATMTRASIAFAVGALLLGALAPSVAAAGGLEVTTPYPAVAVAPGSKVSFDLTVNSTVAGNVALKVDSVPTGWTATLHGGGFVVDGVTASASKDATVRLDVSVPGDAAASTQTLRVDATLGSAHAILPISIRVDAAAAGDITITTTTPTLSGPSTGSFPFALTLHNDTAQDVTVSATAAVTDHPDWDVKAEIAGETQAASTVVTAGSTTSINVTATPPEAAPAGSYSVHVEVKAGEQTIPGDFGVELTGSYSMTFATPNDVLSANGGSGSPTTMQFIITNTGTATLENVALTATPPTGWKVDFDQPTVSVTTDKPVTVTATITPTGEAVAGDYVVSFSAKNDQASKTADVRFTVETSPLWALIGIGIIALILAGLFYVFRTYGRR